VAALTNDERLSGFSSVPDLLANIAQSC
jgi:hypothetical protein